MIRPKPLFNSDDQNSLILRIACSGWFIAKLMSWRIWTTGRLLPTAPVFDFLDGAPALMHTVLFVSSLLLILLVFLKNNKILLAGLLAVETLLCLLDQNRLLPWEYQYLFIIFIFLINSNSKYIIACIAFLLVSTYFYSGLSKLNDNFLHVVWSTMILRGFFRIPANIANQGWVYYTGYLLGIMELLGGIGLLFIKTRARSAMALIVMHLFVLLLLGPWGFKGYKVLWPWNISMILFLAVIFLRGDRKAIEFNSLAQGWNKLVLIFWGILPVLSFFGYWDQNLSSNLFSANLPRMIICVADTSACKPLQRFFQKKDSPNTCHGLAKIDIQNWTMAETSVSIYPEIRVYKQMQAKLQKQYPAAGFSFVYFSHWDKN